MLPVSTENKVITMTMAFTPKALSADYKYSLPPVIPSDVFSDPQIKWVVQKLGAKRVGGLFPNDESGQQVGAANEAAYQAVGAKFVAKEFFERERVDFVPLLTRVLAQNIDAFELDGNSPQTAGLLVKQLRELGFKGPIIRTGGDATADILKIAGKEATENVYVHQPINSELAVDPGVHQAVRGQVQGSAQRLQPVLLCQRPDAVRRHAEGRHGDRCRQGPRCGAGLEGFRHACSAK